MVNELTYKDLAVLNFEHHNHINYGIFKKIFLNFTCSQKSFSGR